MAAAGERMKWVTLGDMLSRSSDRSTHATYNTRCNIYLLVRAALNLPIRALRLVDCWTLVYTIFLLSFVFLCFLLVGLGHSFHEVVPPGTSRGRESAEDPERNPSALLRELESFYLTLSRLYLAPVIHWLRPNSFTRNEF